MEQIELKTQLTLLGRLIKEKRLQNGLTLDELGEKVGYSNPYLSQIENAKRKKVPSKELLLGLAAELGIDPLEILNISGYLPNEAVNAICNMLISDILNTVYVDHIPQEVSEILLNMYPEIFTEPCVDKKQLIKILEDVTIPSYSKFRMVCTLVDELGKHKNKISATLNKLSNLDLSMLPLYSNITYKGKELGIEDKKRIVDMLKIMF